MTEENKPVPGTQNADDAVHTGEGGAGSSNFQPTIDTKANPDPEQWVGYGDRTVDEMAHAWMNVVYLTDAEYAERVAKYGEGVTNGVKPQARTQQQQ